MWTLVQLADILNLNNDTESLNSITEFFDNAITQYEFEAALDKYLKIVIINDLKEFGLNEALILLKRVIDQNPTKYRSNIYYQIILLAIDLERYELAKKYILLRKDVLKELDSYLVLIDEFYLYKAQGLNTYDILIKLKYEVIPQDVKVFVNEQLLNYYIKELEYEHAIRTLTELKEDTLNNKYSNKIIEIKYLMKDYISVVKDTETLIYESTANLYTIAYYISALRELKEYQKASNLEVEYEKSFENSDDDTLKTFIYSEIIKLYEEFYNKPSITEYKNKLSKITKQKKVEEVVLVEKQKTIVKPIKTTTLVSHAKYLEHFEYVNDWLIYSSNLKTELTFREYLRTLFIEISTKVNFFEAVIYLNDENDSNLYHYKNERLYDKRIINHTLSETVFETLIKDKKDYFGLVSSLINNKDILTNKTFSTDFKYLYSFYINDDFLITFYIKEELKDYALFYELFKGIKTIINLRVINLDNNKNLISEAKYLHHLINNEVMPMRIITDTNITYNKTSLKLFNIDNKMPLELFLRDLSLTDSKMYEEALKRLYNYPNETKVIKYMYQDLMILEYIFAYKHLGSINLISFFIDITKSSNLTNTLKEEILLDKNTKLLSRNTLENDFKELIKDKKTFMLVELDTKIEDVYGFTKAMDFFAEFASFNLKHFQVNVYRYDFNKVLIALDFNDIRAVNNQVNDYLLVVNHLNSNILKYEKFLVNIATLRYPVVTSDKNVLTVFKYLDLTLIKAKQENKRHLDFTYSIYEEEVYEQEVIDYLNVAIEERQLSINFAQIIDLENNVVKEYLSELVLPTVNISSNYLTKIAKKRNKLSDLEYFHIELVISFLKSLQDETNHLINVSIPISIETFNESDFDQYLVQTLKKYNIRASFIKLVINGKLTQNSGLDKALKLMRFGIKLDTNNINVLLSSDFSSLHQKVNIQNKKWKLYLKTLNETLRNEKIDLIITDVNLTTERNELKSLGINLITGNLYKKVSPENILKQIKDKI